ncbi:MAG TPA: hypothetical protein VHY79_00465 [Rhizomicrobium sp.]|nr:hypothetical protein [Rhizomicrobium sp.]
MIEIGTVWMFSDRFWAVTTTSSIWANADSETAPDSNSVLKIRRDRLVPKEHLLSISGSPSRPALTTQFFAM